MTDIEKIVYSDYGEELINDRKTCEGCPQYCMDFLYSKCPYKQRKERSARRNSSIEK